VNEFQKYLGATSKL